MFATFFRSLRAITGVAKHGAYKRFQYSWQHLLRFYLPTTRRTTPFPILVRHDEETNPLIRVGLRPLDPPSLLGGRENSMRATILREEAMQLWQKS